MGWVGALLQRVWLLADNSCGGSIEPPVILGTETGFVVLVYMRSSRACEGVIADLDGAGVGGDITLRVGFATDGDLKEALGIQARGPKGGAD